MPDSIYNWKRFWCSRAGHINLFDGGYLYDPDSEYGKIYNPNVVSFESISKVPCLVLLGEPGIGKSMAMTLQMDIIDRQVAETGGTSLWIDLRAYQTDIRLCKAIFENPVFRSWLNGEHQLHLFLDSLDECLLHIETVASLLIEEFKNCPVERLYLRIACRTADWPNSLEEGLKRLWGKEHVEVFELAPLRRADVIEAAKANGLNPGEFMREIDQKEAVPFAIKPVTLQFLINIYKRTGELPSTQKDLYFKGCRLLCEETSDSRRVIKRTGSFDVDQRLSVAARIAAITVFANKYAIWTGIDQGDVPEEDIIIRDLCGNSENANGNYFEVREEAIREVLATGLFSSRGPNRLGWAHQTYAEYLAAWYLVQRKAELVQILSLITHPGDSEKKIVPQLHETAAWLAGMLPEVFREIMRVDPELLLRSDVATADVEDRIALVNNLLKLFDEEKLLDTNMDIRRRYGVLNHPGLADQLRPYICDVTKGIVVRRAAIDIAEACESKELLEDLVDIVLDPSQQLPIRVNAAYAICRIGDNESKTKLKPLVIGEVGDDPDDELKGCGLKAIWPDHITSKELFAVLTPPKRRLFYGAYEAFLSHELVRYIQPADLPVALAWVEKQRAQHKFPYAFERVIDTIILKAWDYLDLPNVLEPFANVVFSRLKNDHQILNDNTNANKLGEELRNNDYKRRRILDGIIPLIQDPQKDSFCIVNHETPIVLSKDVHWMLNRLKEASTEKNQQTWAYLIERVYDISDRIQSEAIFLGSLDNSVLAEVFSWLLKPVDINSPEAQKMKESYYKRQEWSERRQNRPLLKPSPIERITMFLDQFESGNLTAWWRLNMEMTLEPDSTHYGNELQSDLTTLPGWKSVDSAIKKRIVEAAKKYVLEGDPETSQWLGTNTMHRPAFAGYRALLLILKEDPDFLINIPDSIWKKWAAIIIAYPVSSGLEDEGPHQKIVSMAYQHASEEIIFNLLAIIDKENEEHDYIYITRKILGCWDNRIAKALLTKAKDTKLKPKCMGCLLSDLLDHNNKEAKDYAQSLITIPVPTTEKDRSRALVAARVLMNHTGDSGWATVWPAIQQDTEFGRKLVLDVAHGEDRHSASVGRKLSEEQLADLYIWLARQFPHSEDPVHAEAYWLGPRDSISIWRDSILSHLKNRGTYEACKAIQRISQELPEINWLKWILLEARKNARRHTWVPHRPEEILKIVTNQRLRLVNNGDQLLDILIESLNRLEAKLQGETPAIIDLWNENKNDNTYNPKDENRFSDYVKRHLDEDLRQRGIIFNREVEIRHGVGSGTGERTDIHVDAIVHSSDGEFYDSITAIIEVKGCWNKELKHAMKTQLVERYLKDNHCQHGLYLVGWFNCDKWDEKDNRKKSAPGIDISEARQLFSDQANELSKDGIKVKSVVINTSLR